MHVCGCVGLATSAHVCFACIRFAWLSDVFFFFFFGGGGLGWFVIILEFRV